MESFWEIYFGDEKYKPLIIIFTWWKMAEVASIGPVGDDPHFGGCDFGSYGVVSIFGSPFHSTLQDLNTAFPRGHSTHVIHVSRMTRPHCPHSLPIESPTKKPIWLNQNKNKTIKSLKFYFTQEKLYFRLVRKCYFTIESLFHHYLGNFTMAESWKTGILPSHTSIKSIILVCYSQFYLL